MTSNINGRIKKLKKLLEDKPLSFNNSMDWREIKTQIGSKNTNSLQANFMHRVCNDEEFEQWKEQMQEERLAQRWEAQQAQEKRAQEKIDKEAHERRTAGGWSGPSGRNVY